LNRVVPAFSYHVNVYVLILKVVTCKWRRDVTLIFMFTGLKVMVERQLDCFSHIGLIRTCTLIVATFTTFIIVMFVT
jgi:hypothetical protein